MSPFKTSLRLESLDGRVLPNATPLASPVEPSSSSSASANTNEAASTTQIDLAGTQSTTGYEMLISINGTLLPPITIGPNNTPAGVAALIAAAINNAGIDGVSATAEGGKVTITAPGATIIDIQTCGNDNIASPTISGFTGNLPPAVVWNNQQVMPVQQQPQ